jgi:hypothetical protein
VPADSESAPLYDHDEKDVPGSGRSRMEEQVMRWGLDALPVPPPESGPRMPLPPISVDRPAGSPAAKNVVGVPRLFQ